MPVNNGVPALIPEGNKSGKNQYANQAGGSFYNKTLSKKVPKNNGKSLDKKKILPIKKFPELKLMINGEVRNGNNTLSSDDEMNLAVSLFFNGYLQFPPIKKIQQLKDS